jgi:hypothetical protein
MTNHILSALDRTADAALMVLYHLIAPRLGFVSALTICASVAVAADYLAVTLGVRAPSGTILPVDALLLAALVLTDFITHESQT